MRSYWHDGQSSSNSHVNYTWFELPHRVVGAIRKECCRILMLLATIVRNRPKGSYQFPTIQELGEQFHVRGKMHERTMMMIQNTPSIINQVSRYICVTCTMNALFGVARFD